MFYNYSAESVAVDKEYKLTVFYEGTFTYMFYILGDSEQFLSRGNYSSNVLLDMLMGFGWNGLNGLK